MATVEGMRIILDAEMARFVTNLNAADQRFARFERGIGDRLARMDGYFRTFGAALGIGLGTNELKEYAEAWSKLSRTVTAVGPVFGDDTIGKLTGVLNAGRMSIADYGSTVTHMAAAMRGYGFSADDARTATLALAQAFRVGGLEGEAHSSAMSDVASGLANGKIEGDGLAKSLRFARVAQQALASEAGVSREKVAGMLRDGEISAEQFVRAMVKGADSIGKAYSASPASLTESFAVLKNSVTQYVGQIDAAIGVSASLSARMEWMAANMNTVGGAAAVVGAGLLAAFAPAAVAGIGRAAVGMATFGAATAVAAAPLSLIAAVIGGGAAAIALFGDQVKVSADGLVTLKDTAQALIDVSSSQLAPVMDHVRATWATAVDLMRQAIDGLPISLETVLTAVRVAANVMISSLRLAAHMVDAAFRTIPQAIGDAIFAAANHVISGVETMVRGVTDLLNKIPGIKIEPIDIGRFISPYDGAMSALANKAREVGRDMGRDWVGEFASGSAGFRETVAARARELAEARRLARPGQEGQFDRPTSKADKDLSDQARKAAEQVEAVYKRALEATGRHRDAVTAEFDAEVRKFQAMLDKKLISQEQFDRARQNLAIVAAQQMNEAIEREFKRVREVTDAVSSNMESAFARFTQTGKFSFADFSRSVMNDIAKIAFKMMVLQPLFGQSGQGFGMIGSLFGMGGGSVSGMTPVAGFANGGRPPVGVPSIVGERGRELFVPDVPGTIVPNHQLPGRMGGEVVVTVVASPELHASIESTAEGVVARRAPSIVGASLDATKRQLPGMIHDAQRRSL